MSLDDLYRQVIMDHYKHPRNKGELVGNVMTIELNNPTCGDRISVQVEIDNEVITKVKFTGEGCSISLASASMMTHAIKGLTKEQGLAMINLFSKMMQGENVTFDDAEDIEALSGVAKFPARIKCATLAWKALEKGIK